MFAHSPAAGGGHKAGNWLLPHYQGERWLPLELPRNPGPWPVSTPEEAVSKPGNVRPLELVKGLKWRWPRENIYFFSDLHADPDAWVASLVASGGVAKTGPRPQDFRLTSEGRKAIFLVGGDTFDKGPANLQLLRLMRLLVKRGGRLQVLAGNHDLRLLLGMRMLGRTADPLNGHFFVRMGAKVIPLLGEIQRQYLPESPDRDIPSLAQCRRALLPRAHWFDNFSALAGERLDAHSLEAEWQSIRRKTRTFEAKCAQAGLDLRQVYAAALKWRELFLRPNAEFGWFFQRLQLAYQAGSFLCTHAGLDDRMAALVAQQGVRGLNRRFRAAFQAEPFDFYYGPLANVARTKYRRKDWPFTRQGERQLAQAGIQALVHGHRNRLQGQGLRIRSSVPHFECDATLDRHSRHQEGLAGIGAASTIFRPQGALLGVSNDWARIKVFAPEHSAMTPTF